MPQKLLDTHIHLWPSTALSPTDHTWMTHTHKLRRRHGISDYISTTQSSPIQPTGFIYVETDRHLPSLLPPISVSETDEKLIKNTLKQWAKAPLQELEFLRRIVEGVPEGESDGFEAKDSGLLKGLVIYAPFHLPAAQFGAFLDLSREVLGEKAWEKVVGFRYLLQGRGVEGVKMAVQGDFAKNLGVAGELEKVFDVGVDCHRDGVEVLGEAVKLVEKVGKGGGEGVRFVLNHLCKPDLSSTSWPSLSVYSAHLSRLAAFPSTTIKISGAFNEFEPSPTPSDPLTMIPVLAPFLNLAYEKFGAKRMMFASDWPVCNVGGPKGEGEGEERNWSVWRSCVKLWMDEAELGEEDREWIWWRTGVETYRIQGFGEAEQPLAGEMSV